MTTLVERLGKVQDQLELFLWKFPEVGRPELNKRLDEFNRFDLQKRGQLDDHEAMMLLESRGETKTIVELREMVKEIDKDGNHLVSFIEWCCAVYNKPYEALNEFADEAAREKAMEAARLAGDKARTTAALIQSAKEEEERKAAERAAQLEAESKLTGVRGMGAFFARQIESHSDVTLSNEQRIKQEAARRKALREAKALEEAALAEAASKERTAEQVEKELQEARNKAAGLEAARAAQEALAEKQARAERKAALNAKWGGGGGSIPTPSPMRTNM